MRSNLNIGSHVVTYSNLSNGQANILTDLNSPIKKGMSNTCENRRVL